MDPKNVIDIITEEVAIKAREIFGDALEQVILYGSYARGDFNNESDVDIMLLVNLPQESFGIYKKNIYELSGKLSLEYDLTVSIKIMDNYLIHRYKDSLPFYANVLNEGKTIHA